MEVFWTGKIACAFDRWSILGGKLENDNFLVIWNSCQRSKFDKTFPVCSFTTYPYGINENVCFQILYFSRPTEGLLFTPKQIVIHHSSSHQQSFCFQCFPPKNA